jgi:hypothetical protein
MKQKLDLAYFRKAIPADELESHHRKCLFSDDCKVVKNFKGIPDHWHFWSRGIKSCFTISLINGIIKRTSNN